MPNEFIELVAIPGALSVTAAGLTGVYVNPTDEELLEEGKTGLFGRKIVTKKESVRGFFAGVPRGTRELAIWFHLTFTF